ncbi:MAG TPA: ABC transporter substrate-binding protein [Trueperaceae bacterium]
MRTRLLALTLCLTVLGQLASAQEGAFELAFCAQPSSYPISDRERGGFDVEIAEILADELGATATFTWTQFDDFGIRDTLHAGVCDVAVGVSEGVAEMMTTVPYLDAAYAFVTRQEDGLTIESLDDPQLRELRIGTYQSALPTFALRNRGILENVTEYAAVITPTGVDPHTPILDGLVNGEVDVAIVYGPYAAARAAEEEVALSVTPLTPQVDVGPSLLQLSRILTIGVRPRDESLRDAIDRALAARWEDVQAVLDAYGVPRFPVSRPVFTDELAGTVKVGVIFPASTPAALPNGPVGDVARLGAAVAESAVSRGGDAQPRFRVLDAHAPTLASAERAARRLVAVDGVSALVGGYDEEQARALAAVAAELGVPFFNAGSGDDALRSSACYPTTFHVAPSTAMMVAASLTAVAPDAAAVYAVIEGADRAEALAPYVEEVVTAAGAALAGTATVEPGQFVFFPLLQEIAGTGADAVLLIASSDAQEQFISQASAVVPDARLVGVSPVGGQSRPYLERFRQVAPGGAPDPRVVAWDPAVDSDLNETYASRTGEPMEPAAWTTYAAIVATFEAARAGALGSPEELAAFLRDPASAIDVGKGEPVTFREDGQMLQELYVIEADPEARWGRTAAARTAIATVAEVVPASLTADAALPATCEAP